MAARVLSVFVSSLLFITTVSAVLPDYSPSFQREGLTRDELIVKYFYLGLTAPEILLYLANIHGISLSLRQLRRVLNRLGCNRRVNKSDVDEVCDAIETELSGSGSIIGYRAMHQRLTNEYGLVTTRETVRRILKFVDPEGVELRLRHRLRRRMYRAKGPNYLWHIDGYDKLKPFGFCVHGAIDGFSRRILWLEVSSSNNDPRLVASYYVDYIRQLGGTARIIRGDRGTENGNIAATQRFFRRDADDPFANDNSFIYGRSTSNQRIEAWWGLFRRGCTDWWINFFKDMRDSGLFVDDDEIHKECLKFCFMRVLQQELDKVAIHWNTHRIRPSRNPDSPPGRPDTLYFVPQSVACHDYVTAVSEDEIEIAQETCTERSPNKGCSPHFKELSEMIMEDKGLQLPLDAYEARQLYFDLLDAIEAMNVW